VGNAPLALTVQEDEKMAEKIAGYRELTEEEIEGINNIKRVANLVGELVQECREWEGLDQRWVSVGATDLQKGFMALTRSIAKPDSF
jgi:hypothetical protein